MWRLRHRRRIERRLFKGKEALGETVEFCPRLLDDLPLFRKLVRQFFDNLGLMGGELLQPHDTFVVLSQFLPRIMAAPTKASALLLTLVRH